MSENSKTKDLFPSVEVEATASNTLSKSSTIDITSRSSPIDGNLQKAWHTFPGSAKDALDMAVELAKEIYATEAKDVVEKFPYFRGQAVKVFNACEGWYEDEFEVVLDE